MIWTVTNIVYFDDNAHEIFGYQVKDESNTTRRLISLNTADELSLKGQLKVAARQELAFVSVGRDYKERPLEG